MSWFSLRRILLVYLGVLAIAAIGLHAWVSLGEPKQHIAIETWWKDGQRVARYMQSANDGSVRRAGIPEGAVSAIEDVTGEGPLSMHPALFAFALVPGLDGVSVELDGKTAYATVDDLLSMQAYDRGGTALDPSLGLGTHRAVVLHILAEELGARPNDVAERGRFRRVRMKRRETNPEPRIGPENIEQSRVREAIADAARHLARGVDDNGRFRYLIDATSNKDIPAYNWPRHAGTTYFLAQAAALLDDPEIRHATLRAASRLRDDTMVACGPRACIAEDDIADVGSTALAVIALVEVVRTGADASYRRAIDKLTDFLRSLQRPDGELMHLYQRSAQRPLDVQFLYYTGEAALAFARAHRVTNDPRDLEAGSRALHRLATHGWSFFGSRYYFSEEHWTCQAVADLWERAPDREALEFCMRWHEFQRAVQHEEGDSPFDGEGAFGVGPIVTPRVTPAASRGEAAAALLEVLLHERAAGRHTYDASIAPVDLELRRSLAFVLRHQLRKGPTHLFATPDAIRGAFPGSPVDWQLRIDYAQHAGSMMVRWLELSGRKEH
jgi:hypothetical protein